MLGGRLGIKHPAVSGFPHGYVGGGGSPGGALSSVEKANLATETIATLGTAMATTKSDTGGIANPGIASYMVGRLAIDKYAYPSDTHTTVTSTALGAARRCMGWNNAAVAGYYSDGVDTNKLAFPADTSSVVGTFPVGNQSTGGTPAIKRGVSCYVGGGQHATAQSWLTKYTFATDTAALVGASALATARYRGGGYQNGLVAGYFAGGNGSGGPIASVEKLTFASETCALTTALSAVRFGAAGLTLRDSAGFACGGTDVTSDQSTVYKQSFATDAVSTAGFSLATARDLAGGASHDAY